MQTDTSKIESGLLVAFLLPAFGFVVGMIWNKMVGGWSKGWTTFCLVSPIVFLGMIVKFGFASLRAVWLESPFLSPVVYVFFGLVVPALLLAAAIRLWQPRHGRNDRAVQ
jgi:hypothetical protein